MNTIERIDPPDASCDAALASADRTLETLRKVDPQVIGVLVTVVRNLGSNLAFSFHPSGLVPAPNQVAQIMLDGLKTQGPERKL